MNQQGDVYLYQTPDDGEININNGIVEMNGGLETAVYLSLFGGNEEDDGRPTNQNSWWGNLNEVDTAKQYRAETQYLLQSIPATPGNLKKIEDAIKRDLKWLSEYKIASSVVVTVSMPALNTVKIIIDIEGSSRLEFQENWRASA